MTDTNKSDVKTEGLTDDFLGRPVFRGKEGLL
jgi:hypothetical protein